MDDPIERPDGGSDIGRIEGPVSKFQYVRDGQFKTEYVRVKKAPGRVYKPDGEYHPTGILGGCSVCKTIGQVEFPAGFDFKAGDRIMDGKTVKLFCLTCRRMTEFVPMNVQKQSGPGFDLLRRSENVVQEIMGVKEPEQSEEEE
jgi:hypothetical protein